MRWRVALWAVAAGLSVLIPLPWVDGWVLRRCLKGMIRDLLAPTVLEAAVVDTLTEDRTSLLVGCLGAIVRWPIKKLFRTVLVVLILKDVIDGCARAAIVAAMVRRAIERGHLPGRAEEVRNAMETTLGRYDWSPVTRFLLRGERPPGPWIAAEDPLSRVVAALYRASGGAAMLEDFSDRLAEVA